MAVDFNDKYKPKKTLLKIEDVLERWEVYQLARMIVYNHLREVVPALAKQFKDTHYLSGGAADSVEHSRRLGKVGPGAVG